MELEVRHYQRERLREAEAYRRTHVRNVGDTPLRKSNPVMGLTKRLVVAFVALLHQRAA
jgi:hypothetical protein